MNEPGSKLSTISELARQSALAPQESLARISEKNNSLLIGLPKEISLQESRIALTPEGVAILIRNGHEVWVEHLAGQGANFSDKDYSEVGAKIVFSPEEVYKADLILKIEPLIEEEFEWLKAGSTLISALNIHGLTKAYFEKLNQKKVTGIGYELVEDKVGGLPIIRAMSEIVGSSSVLIGAEYLSSTNGGKGLIVGGITGVPPTKIVILGAGTVAEYATRAALGLGADIKVFDKHIYKLQRLKYAINQNIYTAIIDSDILKEAISRADIVIAAMRGENGICPCVVSEDMVSQMRPNSVIIDISIDQGGCIETSRLTNHLQPTFKLHDVIHYCVPNIAARFAHTASTALNNIFLPFLLNMGEVGGIETMLYSNKWIMKGVYCHRGTLTNPHIARKFNLNYKDLSLLMMARM